MSNTLEMYSSLSMKVSQHLTSTYNHISDSSKEVNQWGLLVVSKECEASNSCLLHLAVLCDNVLSITTSCSRLIPVVLQICDDSNMAEGFAVLGISLGIGRLLVCEQMESAFTNT